MRVHHIGYLVAGIDEAVREFAALGWEVRQPKLYDSARKVYLCFLENSGVVIELVSPSEECRLFTALQRRIGNAPYHVCYFPDDVNGFDAAIESLQNAGYFMTQPPESAVAFGGRRVAFMMNPEIGLVEILEADTTEMNDGATILTRLDQIRIMLLITRTFKSDSQQYLSAA
ncbi:MAG: VOC family protein [Synergistaceae bacterium]|nr:VOC family protein [Synergistaceae bacterium]